MSDDDDTMTGESHEEGVPAGWYPVGDGTRRYWDGLEWTDLVDDGLGDPTVTPAWEATEPPPPAPGRPGTVPPDTGPPGTVPPGPGQPDPLTGPTGAPAGGSAPGPGPADPRSGPAGPPPPGSGPLTSDERTMAMLAHLLGIVSTLVGPLVIYLIKKDESRFVRDQSLEALNFGITIAIFYTVYVMVALVLSLVLIGLLLLVLLPLLAIPILIMQVIAGLAANRGEYYRYPVNWRVIT